MAFIISTINLLARSLGIAKIRFTAKVCYQIAFRFAIIARITYPVILSVKLLSLYTPVNINI